MPDVRVSRSSPPYDAQAIASVDGITILGAGTQSDPLRLTAGSADLLATFIATFSGLPPIRGMPVYVSTSPLVQPPALCTVSVASAGPEDPPTSKALPFVVGLIVRVDGSQVTVQTTGVVTLAAGDWDAVTGDSGGLDSGAEYYLADGVFGQLTTVAPNASGTEVALVGVAQSATELRLATPLLPISNP